MSACGTRSSQNANSLPMSGDCWAITKMGGNYASDETAKYLSNIALKSGYEKDEYYIFAAAGSKDIAYQNLRGQINSMKNYTEAFTYTTDSTGKKRCNYERD